MRVPDHLSQHDDPEDLPLITRRGRVALVEPMDADRRPEVERAVRRTLRNRDETELLEAAGTDSGRIDWERLWRALDRCDPSESLRKRLSALRERGTREYPSLVRVRFEGGKADIDFVPGQYVTVRYGRRSRPYSIACSPTEDAIEICIRRVPGGRLSAELADRIEVSDEVTLRGPNGDFTLQDPSRRDMVFLATGTGVAPFKSMIDYAFEAGLGEYREETRHVWLFLGTGWEDDLPYREAFRRLDGERDNFHFVPTLSRERYLTDWDGETDYVQRTLLKYLVRDAANLADLPPALRRLVDEVPKRDVDARIDPGNVEVYACGTNAMVSELIDAAERIGVPDDRIRSEGYG